MKIFLTLFLLIPSLSWCKITYLECVLKDVEKEYLIYKDDVDRYFLNIIIDEDELLIEKAWRIYLGEIDREELTNSKFYKQNNTETINNYNQILKPQGMPEVYEKFEYSIELHRYNLQLKLKSSVDIDWIKKEATIFDTRDNSSRKLTEKELDELYDEFGNSAVEVYECKQKEAVI